MKTPPSIKRAERLERKAIRLWSMRLIDPGAPQYSLADDLWKQAKQIRTAVLWEQVRQVHAPAEQ